jgi:cytochrome P450
MRQPPRVKGAPLFGNALNMISDPLAFLVQAYHEYGPIFRIRVFGREVTVVAGLEANRLLATMGADLAKGGVYTVFNEQLGQDGHFSAVDGPQHFKLRRAVGPGYAMRRYTNQVPLLLKRVRNHTHQWQPDTVIPVVANVEAIMGDLLGTLLAQHPVAGYFDDFRTVSKSLHYVTPMRVWPSFMLKLPSYTRAKDRIFAFAQQIIADHHANPPDSQNLISELLRAHTRDDNPITHEQMIAQVFTPYFVGIDTVGATISFLLYLLLIHPDVLGDVIHEVDTTVTGTVNLDGLPTLERAIEETMRLYPIAPLLARRVMAPFTFFDYDVEVGTELVVATGVTHYLPEFYPEPYRFDIGRNTNVPNGAFSGWGVGPHSCLGAGLAVVLMKVVVGAILRDWAVALHPPDYDLKVTLAPIPNPGPSLQVRVTARA